MIRRLIPSGLKRKIRIYQRRNNDKKSGMDRLFSKSDLTEEIKTKRQLISEIKQPIFYNPLSANKVVNIGISVAEIEKIMIKPGEVFSFWEIVGDPTIEKGYKVGRNIIGDRLQEDIGGGLCQVSGMIYHLALVSGMEIIERHNHTIDLYEEDKRYTPLGADATVVYGYKDLRFKNPLETPVFLTFQVSEEEFQGFLHTTETAPTYSIKFERKEFDTYRTIETYRSITGTEKSVHINSSKYLLQ